MRNHVIRRKYPATWIVGTPEQCSETLLNYKHIGMDEFMLYVVDAAEKEPLRIFAEKAMPAISPT